MRKITRKSFWKECRLCLKKSRLISQNGLCINCLKNQVISANYQMKTKQGPAYEKWKKRMLEFAERIK